jgi:LDH2 family malate/lactate/ureidoglycolate dehydrogenase
MAVEFRVQAPLLRQLGTTLMERMGVPTEDAALVTDVHVDSDLRGEESHGVRLFLMHLERLRAGTIRPKPKVTVLRDHGAIALFDAHHSMGQVVAARAMALAIEKARRYGIGAVSVRMANSFTSTKYYPLIAAREGMIGIARSNSRAMMPPEGGITRKVGNNPMAIAAPTEEEPVFVLDFACTVAREKIRMAAADGRPIPADWALDRAGNPTTDAAEALTSGIQLPFGGYKAFGLGVAHEVLTSVLAGGDLFTGTGSGFVPYDNPYHASQFFQAINIEAFGPLEAFRTRMDEMIRSIRSAELRPGVERVYLPGERGQLEMVERQRDGIPVAADVRKGLERWCLELGVEFRLG